MSRTLYPTDLTDGQWQLLEAPVPRPKPGGRPARYSRREIVNALLYQARNGCVWRGYPQDLPPYRIVFHYFRAWQKDGAWDKIHDALREKVRRAAGKAPRPSAAVLGGPGRMAVCALSCTAAAGIAWALPLPALYILNSLSGSRLRASTTFLAALVTTSWGGLALMASIPINWFFTAAIPVGWFVLLVNLVVFAGVGAAMSDVFARVMERLEPQRGRVPGWWLCLVGAIGAELFYAFGLFDFSSIQQAVSRLLGQ